MLYYQEYNVLQKATEAGEKKNLCLKTNGMENFSQKLVRVMYRIQNKISNRTDLFVYYNVSILIKIKLLLH
jgi:hypothetical protein